MNFLIKISPSLLSADYGTLREAARQAEKAGGCELHLDIMDGHYVHNFSFGIDIIPALKRHVKIPLITHLEIDNPDVFIHDFANAGSDMIVVQEDTCPHLPITITGIRKRGNPRPDRPSHHYGGVPRIRGPALFTGDHPKDFEGLRNACKKGIEF